MTTVYVIEDGGRLSGPFASCPQPGREQTVHETAGGFTPLDPTRDWFECPHCLDVFEVGELAGGTHACGETALDR